MTHKNMSNAVAEVVDAEIRRIIDEQYSRARAVIEENRDKIEIMAKALIEWETLDAAQIDDIMAGRKPQPPQDTSGAGGSPRNGKKPETPVPKPRLDTPAGEH